MVLDYLLDMLIGTAKTVLSEVGSEPYIDTTGKASPQLLRMNVDPFDGLDGGSVRQGFIRRLTRD